jgi:excisionase family DNA binding protein
VENEVIISPQEEAMTYASIPHSSQLSDRASLDFPDFEPLLDTAEAASLLRIHPKTLQKMARRGDILGHHVGKCWRFRVSDLNSWLSSQNQVA